MPRLLSSRAQRGICTRSFLAALGMTFVASVASAQDVFPLTAPAERVLRLRAELGLDSIQVAKLRDLSRTQSVALSKATSAFLRTEADVVDASRSEDLAIRRTALERRSRSAIDGEMLRLRNEKETTGLLTARQNDLLGILTTTMANDSGARYHAVWESQVMPLPLNAVAFVVPDSGNMRVTVDPLTTEIYIADKLVGFGRLATRLPLGQHVLKFRTPDCIEERRIVVEKGPPTIVTHKMNCLK
jgi:hypothetical protein